MKSPFRVDLVLCACILAIAFLLGCWLTSGTGRYHSPTSGVRWDTVTGELEELVKLGDEWHWRVASPAE